MISSRNGRFRYGSRIISRDEMSRLITNMSAAKGLLATLELGHHYPWTRKLRSMDVEHLRILLQAVMDEIWHAEKLLNRITSY